MSFKASWISSTTDFGFLSSSCTANHTFFRSIILRLLVQSCHNIHPPTIEFCLLISSVTPRNRLVLINFEMPTTKKGAAVHTAFNNKANRSSASVQSSVSRNVSPVPGDRATGKTHKRSRAGKCSAQSHISKRYLYLILHQAVSHVACVERSATSLILPVAHVSTSTCDVNTSARYGGGIQNREDFRRSGSRTKSSRPKCLNGAIPRPVRRISVLEALYSSTHLNRSSQPVHSVTTIRIFRL